MNTLTWDKDGKAVKFLARDDSDADLYRNKVGLLLEYFY